MNVYISWLYNSSNIYSKPHGRGLRQGQILEKTCGWMGTPKADRYLQSYPMFLISPCKVRVRNRAGQVVAKWWRKGLAQSYFRHHPTPIASHYTWCTICKGGLVCNDAISYSPMKAGAGRVWGRGHIMTSLGPVPAVGSGYVCSA